MPTRLVISNCSFQRKNSANEHLALIKGEWEKNEPVLVRAIFFPFYGRLLGSLGDWVSSYIKP
jgi:3,4-dihydroxy 2-butanone 4-phosphate synthase/GTP cyclohydrolase II